MKRNILLLLIAILFSSQSALPETHYKAYILSTVNNSVPEKKFIINAEINDKCELIALVECGDSGVKNYYSDFNGSAKIDGKTIEVKKWDSKNDIKFSWNKIEPEMKHKSKGNDPTAPDFLWYTNAYTPGPPKEAKGWIDFDKVEYAINEVENNSNNWRIKPDANPVNPAYNLNNGLGVMRYCLKIDIDGKTFRTADNKSVNYLGITDDVYKIVVRKDTTYTGYASSYFNVPGIFGSHEKQADKYIGVDCADLVVAAYRKWRGKDFQYTGVNELIKQMTPYSDKLHLLSSGEIFKDEGCTIKSSLKFREGAIVVFDYPNTVKVWYDHIGIVYADNGDGMLDGMDTMLHCGPMEPRLYEICSQGGDAANPTTIRFFQWKEK